jgi:nucleotide-binding universal stress UspA family protein
VSDRPALIAFDESEQASNAIAVAAELLGGGPAEVVHAWEPATSGGASAVGLVPVYDESGEAVELELERAREIAARGAELASAAGFDATPRPIHGAGPIWQMLVDRAAELGAGVVVMGTHSRTGLRSALAGSVSHGVASHAACPVLIVPLR